MARYSEIENSFWEDFQDYSKNEKLLYLFAVSNSGARDSGMYRISMKTILLNTGLSQREFQGALKGLGGKLYYDFEEKIMFVVGKFKRRLKGLKNNTNVIKGLQHDLDDFSSSFISSLFVKKYEGALKGLSSLSLPLPIPLPLPKEEESTREEEKESVGKFMQIWNEKTKMPIRSLTGKRMEKLRTRLKDPDFEESFSEVCEKVAASKFLNGDNKRGWKCSFDWIIENDTNYVKVLEGKYDSHKTVDDFLKEIGI